jgi:3-hydroxyisobutyrate dehydrogenase
MTGGVGSEPHAATQVPVMPGGVRALHRFFQVEVAKGLGIETERVVDALQGNPLVSVWQKAKLHRIAKGEFSAQFALSLALKDVRLAQEAADGRLEAMACLADEWQEAVEQGLGDQDLTVVTRSLEQKWGRP